jgi:hypothetical protein
MIMGSSLAGLARARQGRRRRASSWDRTGGNADFVGIGAGQTVVLCDLEGAGIIRHIWCTMASPRNPLYARTTLLRMFWDDAPTPCVEAPIGDFFGIGHGIVKNFVSLPLTMSPEDGRGFNCFFPMPFSSRARIEVTNEADAGMIFYYYVDYEEHDRLEDDLLRFHAQWRRENPTEGWGEGRFDDDIEAGQIGEYRREVWGTPNLDGKGNYVILEAEGRGHYVGCNLNIDCFSRQKNDWYGEGDDMIFIDGDAWPPTLHGTGTEDYFNTAFSPRQEFSAPYHGLTVYSGTEDWPYKGKNSSYRFHIEDPIMFQKSIRVTIEHGHANNLWNDYSSTAYWYQTEPHVPFPPMLPVDKRLPRPDGEAAGR